MNKDRCCQNNPQVASYTHLIDQIICNDSKLLCDKVHCYIHSFIVYRLSDIYSGHGEPVPISGVIGHQGRIHPGRSANPSQGTHTYTLIHSRNHTLRPILEMPINLSPTTYLDRGRKLEYPEETSEARGEHANSTHTAEAGIEPPTLEV
ncbi:hypothetical protein QTP86_021146 [Hemibagrus guttatus]|nr:hypothetical protein QTP86_021146 [Hemibagrus guttatus]